ncbi:hypothetical protein [Anaerosphaera multitolerans]|uniref:Uncharacterized protein n=1 Tax=Anaerosphaera multitolerans TaxID=2487351 RepID=A0A437S8Z7_9FIRM|nr:hypothetical protein [Anaerosphaera multitolerans]RVU55492.1 hypothetical protein EF514_01825 [Anaerosphaera multitolerans]
MKKIFLLIASFSLIILPACSNKSKDPDNLYNYFNRSEMEKITNLISNYELAENFYSEDIDFDTDNLIREDHSTYIPVSGNNVNSYEEYRKLLKNTLTKEEYDKKLNNIKSQTSPLKIINGKLYMDSNYKNHVEELNKEYKINFENIKVIVKKDNVVVISYEKIPTETNQKSDKYSRSNSLVLVEEKGKYLVDKNLYDRGLFSVNAETLSKIRKYFEITDDKTTLIVEDNRLFDFALQQKIYKIFEVEGSELKLKFICRIDNKNEKIEQLEIEDNKIINPLFTELNSFPDTTLLVSHLDTNSPEYKEIVDPLKYVYLNQNKENVIVPADVYVFIPKYLDYYNTLISSESGNSYISMTSINPTNKEGTVFIKLNSDDTKVEFEFTTAAIKEVQELPMGVKNINSIELYRYLEKNYK